MCGTRKPQYGNHGSKFIWNMYVEAIQVALAGKLWKSICQAVPIYGHFNGTNMIKVFQ